MHGFSFLTWGDGTLVEFDNTPGFDGTGIPAGPPEACGSPGFIVGGKDPEPPGPMPDLDCFKIKCKTHSNINKLIKHKTTQTNDVKS